MSSVPHGEDSLIVSDNSPHNRFIQCVAQQLEILSDIFDIDLNDENLKDTPRRVADAFGELLCGYHSDPRGILSRTFSSDDYDQMVVVKNIRFYSLCAHHLLPFHGFVTVGYLPNSETKKVVGLSKIPRLVKMFSRRLQVQEKMTQEIARAIDDCLNPAGVGVVVHDSIHLCAHMRGIEESNSTMTTSALYGSFRTDPDVRNEFLKIVSHNG